MRTKWLLFVSFVWITSNALHAQPLPEPSGASELESIFAAAKTAQLKIKNTPDGRLHRREITTAMNAELEDFLTKHPNSPSAPAVHNHLAQSYRGSGRMTQAFEHWEAAWERSKHFQTGKEKMTADLTLAYWTRMLALLGRTEELSALYEEVGDRTFDGGPLTQTWLRTRKKHSWMVQYPERSYKCGLFAMDQVGQVLKLSYDRGALLGTPSKITGFSMEELNRIALAHGLGLVAVSRAKRSSQIVVPSIVHWRQDHFSAITKQRDGYFKIDDPSGLGVLWLTAEEIEAEASGYFMIPQHLFHADFSALSGNEAARVVGRAGGCPPEPGNDAPCESCPCPPGAGNNGPPGGSSPDGCKSGRCGGPVLEVGMPTWRVSEPHINLWIEDAPLHYQPAKGPAVTFKIRNNAQKEFYYDFPYDMPLVGLAWECDWFSAVVESTSSLAVSCYLPGGGKRYYEFSTSSVLSDTNYWDNSRVERLVQSSATVGYIVHFPDGQRLQYTNAQSYASPMYYMTERFDAQSNKLSFNYTGLNITSITDADGNQTSLYYTNATCPYDSGNYTNILTRVVAPDGRQANLYHGQWWELTNIVDAAGISSSVTTDLATGFITSLTTPYGTTSFAQGQPGGGSSAYDWYVAITEPGVGTQVYLRRNDGPINGMPTNFLSAQMPTNTPFANGTYPYGTMAVTNRDHNTTLYWNAQQWASLSDTNFGTIDWGEYKRARIRRWLNKGGHSAEKTLSHEQAPSQDGTTEGQITWYDHEGKNYTFTIGAGTQIMPAVIAKVMPDGSTWYQHYERNALGKATKVIEKWESGGAAHYRTNQYLYAANGIDLLAHTNALGFLVESNVFNEYHQVTTNYNGFLEPTVYTYNASRQLTSISRPGGLITTNVYDGNGRLQSTTDLPINRTETFTWYSDGNLKSHTDARGLTVTNFWDGLNRLTGTKYPDGTTTTNLYTAGGTNILDLTATKDRDGHWTYIGYDSVRRKIAETNANNVVTRYGYCDCGGVSSVTNAWGTAVEQVTTFNYDYQGNPTIIQYADGYSVTNWFNSLGKKVATGDGWGFNWFGFDYDNRGMLTSVTNGLGSVEKQVIYDLEDQPLFVTDANGVTVTNDYDTLGRLISRGYPDGGLERFDYSARGLTAHTNQLNQVTRYAYDEAGRKTLETNANLEVIRYTNSAAGDLLSLTDGKNQTTKWNYDEYGRVTNKVDQANTVILRYKYDADGHLTNRWSVARGNTGYSYDPAGNLTNVNYTFSPDLTFRYDALNRLTNMTDAAGTTKFTYTAGNQLLTEDGPFTADTVTNSYLNRLRVGLDLQQSTGLWTNAFGYDAAKRLTNVISSAGTFVYDYQSGASRAVKKLLLPNTSYITNTYDNMARTLSTTLKNSSHATLNAHSYLYNVGNQRTNQTFASGDPFAYAYDNIGQLLHADSTTASEDRGYFYDAAWNLNRRTNNVGTETFSVGSKNQLTTTPFGTASHDGNGNLFQHFSSSEEWNYTFDDENQLTGVEFAERSTGFELQGATTEQSNNLLLADSFPIWSTSFVYDGKGRLRQRLEYTYDAELEDWNLTNTTSYIYDGMRVIQERSGDNTPQVSYTRGNDLSGSLEGAGGIGGLLARSQDLVSGSFTNHHFYHADGNGNITYLVDGSQSMAATYRYDPFGNIISQSGTMATTNVYRFSSKQVHDASAMYYYGYRWYQPNLQRWMNRDPIEEKGGINLHVFIKNSPVDHVDFLGLSCLTCTTKCVNSCFQDLFADNPGGAICTTACVQCGAGNKTFCGACITCIGAAVGGVYGCYAYCAGGCLGDSNYKYDGGIDGD